MLLSITKNEILYSLYISSFEQIKKNLSSKDNKYLTIKTACDNLNKSKTILSEDDNLEKYSLILVKTLENCTIKILEIILKAYEEIIKEDLIIDIILQKMTPILLTNINKYLIDNEINIKLSQKILIICELIYNNKKIFIHNNNFRTMLEIGIKISLIEKENNNKSIVYKTFISFINKMFNSINIDNNNLNYISFMVKIYIDFLIDLVEIQNNIKDDKINIINKYLNLIEKQILDNNINIFKKEIELLELDKLNIYKDSNNKIGKYGWCIFCRKTSNNWNSNLNFPLCDSENCEKQLKNILSNDIYYINDYFVMISFLSKIKCNNLKTIELFLETIKEMINKGIKYFKNDKRMINTIKEIFKDFIIKNALQQNIRLFQLSLDIFNIIFINYRTYLKEQIEIFFMNIFIGFLESEIRTFNYKNIIIDNFAYLLNKIGSNFLIEIYVNYDLDSNFNAIFCVLINLFTKIKNGLFLQNKYSNTFKDIEEINIIEEKLFEFLNRFVVILNEMLTKKNMKNNLNKNISDMKNPYDEIMSFLQKNNILCSEESFNIMKKEYIEDYNNNTIKEDYSYIFSNDITDNNIKSNLIPFILSTKKEKLPDLTYIDYTFYEIAQLIFSDKYFFPNIELKTILYNEKDMQTKILYYYIQIIGTKFKNKNILESLRILFSFLPITNNESIINNIILFFGEIYYNLNKTNEFQNINMIYYISFALLKLNNNLHNKNTQKITQDKFIEEITQYYNINTTKGKYLYDTYSAYYEQISKEPISFLDNESQIEIDKKELKKDNIYKINIENSDIRKFIEFSWNNFLYIFNQSINESIKKRNRELFFICIDNILILSKICGILNLERAQEMFLNTIFNMINLKEKEDISEIMIEIIIKIMNNININCQYIKSTWNKILEIISTLEYYLLEPEENIILNLRNSKFTEKEIKKFLEKREYISLNISDAICESIFIKTELFENEILISFIQNLCIISKQELDSYIPRFFSLNKLVELTQFNLFRDPFYWNQIWRILSNYLGEIIIKIDKENIWRHALDSLKQIVILLLQKKNHLNLNYKFQEEIFIIFEKIFTEVNKINIKGESIIDVIYFIIAQYGKSINNGWKNILDIIQIAYDLKNMKINNIIINILKYINDNSYIIFIKNSIEIFDSFMKNLCLIYNDKSMKQFGFETIIGILDKIISEDNIILKMPSSNKIYDFIKIFFYNLDTFMNINIIEYLNLLFEIINHNKKILLSKNLNIFIYIYIIYFKLIISLLLVSKFDNKLSLFNLKQESINSIYSFISMDKEIEIMKNYIEQNIILLINNFILKEGKEYEEIFYENDNRNKIKLIGFLQEIKNEININNGTFENYIRNKISELKNIDENNFELFLKYFFEKFKNSFIKENKEKEYIKYNYFYVDLILTIQELSIFNNNSELIYKILFKTISSSLDDISELNKNKLINNNNIILKIISSTEINLNNEKDLFKYIKYCLDFSNYFLQFIQIFNFEFTQSFKFISKLFNNILLLDLENKNTFENYKITNSSSTIVLLMKLQDIQLFIIKKTKKEKLKMISNKDKNNTIIYLNKIYEKYLLDKDENSLMNKIYIFELENILPKFIELLNEEELNDAYECLINLIGSFNHNIRQGAKNILKSLINNKLIILNNKNF